MGELRAAADTQDLQRRTYHQFAGEKDSSIEPPLNFSSETSQSDLETTEQGTKPRHQHNVTMATISDISTKYNDIISQYSSTHSGSPALYQLRPKEEKIGTLTRKTVGERNYNKMNKTILLVGETGTGKSTLINALVNYAMGVKFEDDIWFKIAEEEKRSQSESQTSDVVVYEIFGFEDQTLPFSLTIIDTPGFGDTRGIEHDVIISQRLFDLFSSEEGVHEVSAVGLVMKASENRLSDRLKYIFNSVMSLFGKNLEENIVTLITHSDGLSPDNALKALDDAEIKCARDKKNQPVHFLFNNRQTTQKKEMNKKSLRALKNAWETTHDGMGEFTEFLLESKPQKLMTTVEVLISRIRLMACVQNLEERIQLIELKQTEIRQMKEALEKHEEEMKKDEKFTVDVDEVYKDKETIKGGKWWGVFYEGAVTCNICEENCHYPGCTMAWSPRDCEVIKKGHCTVCTKKCPAEHHVKEERIYVTKTRKVKKTLQDMKAKCEENKVEREKKTNLLENLEEEIKDLTAEKDQCFEEVNQHVVRLDEIALNVKSVSIYAHMDFLIEKMKEKGDTEKIKKLMEMKNRVDEKASAGVRYVFGKLTAAGKAVKGKII